MKLSDFSKSSSKEKIAEINNYGTTAIKQFFNRGQDSEMSTVDKRAKDIFISNFVGRAYGSLNAAINGGIVDPSLTSPAAPPTAPAPAPAASEPENPAAGAGAFGQMAGQLRAKAPPEKTSTGGTLQQTPTGQVHTANPNNPNIARPAAPAAAPARPAAPAAPSANNSPAGIAARRAAVAQSKAGRASNAILSKGWSGAKNAAKAKGIAFESRYDQLNNLFESILEDEEHTQSITEFLNNWLAQYLGRNVSTSSLRNQVNAVQATYDQDKGKAAMTKLANAAYALAYSAPTSSQQPTQTGQPQPAGAQSAVNLSNIPIDQLPGVIANGLAILSKKDPKSASNIINQYKGQA